MRTKRLELTWSNKDRRLLSHGSQTYEWVDPSDWRVSEVRLLEHVMDVGEDPEHNLVIHGDALHALTCLTTIPELNEVYVGKVKLCYIDPPFNTGQTFSHYDDAVEHSVWLTMLRDRLVQIHKLLCDSGSVWVHLDDSEQHRARCVLDEVFGPENFVATIVWEKDKGRRNDTDISTSHDYLMVYAKEHKLWSSKRNLLERTEAQISRYKNSDNDPRGPWLQGDNGTAQSGEESARFPVTLPSDRIVRPPKGNCWRFSPEVLEQARREGRVWFGRDGDSMTVIKRITCPSSDGGPRGFIP